MSDNIERYPATSIRPDIEVRPDPMHVGIDAAVVQHPSGKGVSLIDRRRGLSVI